MKGGFKLRWKSECESVCLTEEFDMDELQAQSDSFVAVFNSGTGRKLVFICQVIIVHAEQPLVARQAIQLLAEKVCRWTPMLAH